MSRNNGGNPFDASASARISQPLPAQAPARGGPPWLPPHRLATARDLLAANRNHSDVARTLQVARTTLYRALTTDLAESPDAPGQPCRPTGPHAESASR